MSDNIHLHHNAFPQEKTSIVRKLKCYALAVSYIVQRTRWKYFQDGEISCLSIFSLVQVTQADVTICKSVGNVKLRFKMWKCTAVIFFLVFKISPPFYIYECIVQCALFFEIVQCVNKGKTILSFLGKMEITNSLLYFPMGTKTNLKYTFIKDVRVFWAILCFFSFKFNKIK